MSETLVVLKRTTARVAGELRVFARDHDTRVRFIADGMQVPDAERLVATEFFETDAEAADVAAACAGILNSTRSLRAGLDGWHQLPDASDLGVFLANLLRAARQAVWTSPNASPDPPPSGAASATITIVANGDVGGTAKKDGRTKWAVGNEDMILLIAYAERGYSTKKIARLFGIKPNTVSARARRLGIRIGASRGRVTCNLPTGAVHRLDKAAAAMGEDLEIYVARLLTYDARHPGRLQVVAG